ncbi:MAG: hypothetical protein II410_07970, partial [Ruminococcus sp.]|nr:hypothetical protein [Ruminococcus sp.]
VERSYYTGEEINGKGVLRAELIADTAAELTGVTEVGGNVLDFGSIAHAVDDAQILRLDSSGDWIIQTGDDAGKTPAEVASSKAALSAPKTALAKAIEDEWSEEIEGDGTGEPLPEVEKTAYSDDVETLEPVETVDTEIKKAVSADDRFE